MFGCMVLNIKDPETERLAAEVAALTGESKTGAVRTALRERKERLALERSGEARSKRLRRWLGEEFWPTLPSGVRGSTIAKEEEELLGLGSEGV